MDSELIILICALGFALVLTNQGRIMEKLDAILADEQKMKDAITSISNVVASLNTEIENLKAAQSDNDPVKLQAALDNADTLVQQLNAIVPATPVV